MAGISAEDYIKLLMRGDFFEGYVEGAGIAAVDHIMVASTSSPFNYDPLVTRDSIFYHQIEKPIFIPLKVNAPSRRMPSGERIMEIWKKAQRPNFSEKLNDWVMRLEEETLKQIATRNATIGSKQKEIAMLQSGDLADKASKIGKLNFDIDKLQNEIGEYQEVLDEVATLALSDQRYDVEITTGGSTSSVSQGMLSVDLERRTILVCLPHANVSLGFFAHELKHAYQFEVGRLSLRENRDGAIGGGDLYDKYDEMEAFNRGRLYWEGTRINSIDDLPAAYQRISPRDYDVNTYPWKQKRHGELTPERLQQISTERNNIIRYKGRTYFPQK